jgi:hypothetical protein
VKTKIPIEIIELEAESYHVLCRIIITNNPALFIIDTGASKSVLDKRFKQHLTGLPSKTKRQQAVSVNKKIKEFGTGILPLMHVSGIRIEHTEFTLIDLRYLNRYYQHFSNYNIDGILGCDFLKAHRAVLDFSNETLQVSDTSITSNG